MRKALFSMAIVFVLMAVPVSAEWPSEEIAELNEKSAGKKMPGFAAFMFGNERVNAYAELDTPEKQSEIIFSIVTEEGIFVGASTEAIEEPTVELYVPNEIYEKAKIAAEDNNGGGRVILEAYQQGKIRKEIPSFLKNMKFKLFGAVFSKFQGN